MTASTAPVGRKLTQRLLWDNVKSLVQSTQNGYLLFDDTVLDKRYWHQLSWHGGSTVALNIE